MSKKSITIIVSKLEKAISKGKIDVISEYEDSLADGLEDCAEDENFCKLPMKHIISIVKRSQITQNDEKKGFQVMQTLLRNLSIHNEAEAPLLLNICHFPLLNAQ